METDTTHPIHAKLDSQSSEHKDESTAQQKTSVNEPKNSNNNEHQDMRGSLKEDDKHHTRVPIVEVKDENSDEDVQDEYRKSLTKDGLRSTEDSVLSQGTPKFEHLIRLTLQTKIA
jgi:hypothetical protein